MQHQQHQSSTHKRCLMENCNRFFRSLWCILLTGSSINDSLHTILADKVQCTSIGYPFRCVLSILCKCCMTFDCPGDGVLHYQTALAAANRFIFETTIFHMHESHTPNSSSIQPLLRLLNRRPPPPFNPLKPKQRAMKITNSTLYRVGNFDKKILYNIRRGLG